MMFTFPIGVSARHIHLCAAHVEALFGQPLTVLRPLSQPGQFAAEQTVRVETTKGCFERVRVLGPARTLSQLEISRTDAILLGLTPPVRLSGDIAGTPGIRIIGPAGTVVLSEGVIVAARHIHMSPQEAQQYQLRDHQRIALRIGTERSVVLEEVIVRVHEQFTTEVHIDTDEANAAGVQTGDRATLIVV